MKPINFPLRTSCLHSLIITIEGVKVYQNLIHKTVLTWRNLISPKVLQQFCNKRPKQMCEPNVEAENTTQT